MLDSIRKTLLIGVGLAAITKDKIDEHVKELVEKGKITEGEAKTLAQEILEKSDQARKDFQDKVEKAVEKSLAKLNVATKNDIDALTARITTLETTIGTPSDNNTNSENDSDDEQ